MRGPGCKLRILAYEHACALVASVLAQSLPSVDLGYQVHRAISFNVSGGYYNFSNVRYGQPPLGNLRFAKPLPPQSIDATVDDGSVGRVCPPATPSWLAIGSPFVKAYTTGQPFDFTAANNSLALAGSNVSALPPPHDPRATEDCLFLDVMVPKPIFDSTTSKNASGSPVLVWIYGGGYCYGDKTSVGNPAGLVKASQISSSGGVIVVLLNYRLGAFGFLAGPTLQQANGTTNAGLYDQRLALQWVQKYIHLFGGNPKRVTVMGESAGGGSIVFQITAFGGSQGPAPFQQAIIQSPAWGPDIPVTQQEDTLQQFLHLLNVSSIQQARQLPSATLMQANSKLVRDSPYGNFIVDPVVDGVFAPATPGQLLLRGSFDHNVRVMNGHNSDEAPIFTRPYVNDTSSFASQVQFWLPEADASMILYITNLLYPAVFNGLYPYHDHLSRAILFVSDLVITCNTNYLDRAFNNQTYGYMFAVPPGLHAQDTRYTFYNGPGMNDTYGTYNLTIAQALQQYIITFTGNGFPDGGSSFPSFPLYGNGTILNLSDVGFAPISDMTANQRCLYLQQALFKRDAPILNREPASHAPIKEYSIGFLGLVLMTAVGLQYLMKWLAKR